MRSRLQDNEIDNLIGIFQRLSIQDNVDMVYIIWEAPWNWNNETFTLEHVELTIKKLEELLGDKMIIVRPLGFINKEGLMFANKKANVALTFPRKNMPLTSKMLRSIKRLWSRYRNTIL